MPKTISLISQRLNISFSRTCPPSIVHIAVTVRPILASFSTICPSPQFSDPLYAAHIDITMSPLSSDDASASFAVYSLMVSPPTYPADVPPQQAPIFSLRAPPGHHSIT